MKIWLAFALVFAARPAAAEEFKTSDGVRLHYIDAGKGRPIVFIPGWTMPAEIWSPQIEHFRKSRRVIALDPRSQGQSETATSGHTPERRARDIQELLEHLRLKDVALVGWSLGGYEVMAYVKQFGEDRLSALILVDHSIGYGAPGKPGTTRTEMQKDREATVASFVKGMYRKPQRRAYLDRITQQSLRTPPEVAAELLNTQLARETWPPILKSLHTPVLYVVTGQYAQQAEELKSDRPWFWTEVFWNSGHALFVDEARRFNRLVERFLTQEAGKN